MSKYSELLRDPRWQKKRLEILERDNWSCESCGSKDNTLHVHHLKYQKGNPWDTDERYLQTLCDKCHEEESAIDAINSCAADGITFSILPSVVFDSNSEQFNLENKNYKKLSRIIAKNRLLVVAILRSRGCREVSEL